MSAADLGTVVARLGEAVAVFGVVDGSRVEAEPTAGAVTAAAVLVRAAGPDVADARGAVLDPDPDPDPDPFVDVDRPVGRLGEPPVVGSRGGPVPEHAVSSTVTATAAVTHAAVVRPAGGIS